MTPSFVSTPTGAKIATYTLPGEGSVFVVGGLSGHPISASPLAEALERSDARCTMMDIASSGESRHGEFLTMETWLGDIEHVFMHGGGGACDLGRLEHRRVADVAPAPAASDLVHHDVRTCARS